MGFIKCVQPILAFEEFHFSRERFMEPCVICCIVFLENVNETDADGNIANHDSIVFRMSLLLNIVIHPLGFLFPKAMR